MYAPNDPSPPQALLDALARSDADLEAGRTAPWPEARARLLALQAELEAEKAHQKA